MIRITLLFFLLSLNLLAQTNRVFINSGPVKFTSQGDSWGTKMGVGYEQVKKNFSIEAGFHVFQAIKTAFHYYNLEPNPDVYYKQEFRTGFFTNSFYLVPNLKTNFKRKFIAKVGIGPVFSVEQSSAPTFGYTVLFPYITKLPDPIFVLKYPKGYKEYSVGYLGKFEIEIPVSKRLQIGISTFIQQSRFNLNYGIPVSLSLKI